MPFLAGARCLGCICIALSAGCREPDPTFVDPKWGVGSDGGTASGVPATGTSSDGDTTATDGETDSCACDPVLELCGQDGCECRAGTTQCNAGCVNLQTSKQNCGECGTKCGGQTCVAGTCQGDGCPAELTQCGAVCTNAQVDPLHCGACDAACAPAETCESGTCVDG